MYAMFIGFNSSGYVGHTVSNCFCFSNKCTSYLSMFPLYTKRLCIGIFEYFLVIGCVTKVKINWPQAR